MPSVVPAHARVSVRGVLVALLLALLACGPAWGESGAVGGRSDDAAALREAAARVDLAVFTLLRERGVQPAEPCSDEVFVRRLFIDVIGTLPTPEELEAFHAGPESGRRERLIDDVLRRPEFDDLWSLKLGDLLRVKAEFPINLWPNAAQAYHRWLREAVASRMPLDRLARSLLVSNGSNFRNGPVNFHRAVQRRDAEGLAQAAALFFLGQRIEHWPAARREGFTRLFSQVGYKATSEWKEEIVFFDPSKAPAGGIDVVLPDDSLVKVPAGTDPRQVFADWLLRSDNPAFARALANRLWSWLFGRGVVHEPDDLRPDNPPANPALLDQLARELTSCGYDLRRFFALVLRTRTYQLSSVAASGQAGAEALFACYPVRRLDAEVLIDALCQLTGTSEQYVSAIPEPFTYSPRSLRSIALPDGSISSPFLELFGRPARDTGLESERNNAFTPLQRLHLLNSTHVRSKLEQGPRIQEWVTRGGGDASLAKLWRLALSREPLPGELAAVRAHLDREALRPRQRVSEVLWLLVNSNEFLHRH